MTQVNVQMSKYVWLTDMTLRLFDFDRNIEQRELNNIDEVIEAVKLYFPNFPIDIVARSYKQWYDHDRKIAWKR